MMALTPLIAEDLVRIHGQRRVVDGISLTISPGQRVGLIGDNGTGKSTLLRLLAGLDTPDAGSISRPPDLGFVQQEAPFAATMTVAEVIADALRENQRTLLNLEQLGQDLARAVPDSRDHQLLLDAYGVCLQRAEQQQAWDATRRAEVTLGGLGLAALPHQRAVAELSGGQRNRLSMAAVLIRRPSALLLDEPTNHLDEAALSFCEGELRRLPGVVVLASHDRDFLDAVCTDIVDIDPALGGAVRYGGTYSQYLTYRRGLMQRWREHYLDEQEQLTTLRQAVAVEGHGVAHGRQRRDNEKMGAGHTAGRVQNQMARRVRDARRRLQQLEQNQVPAPPQQLHLYLPRPIADIAAAQVRPPRLDTGAVADAVASDGTAEPESEATGQTEATYAGAEATPGDDLIFDAEYLQVPGRLHLAQLQIHAADRLLVSGPSGVGKSTLLAVLAGQLPTQGHLWSRPGLRSALLTQDTVFATGHQSARETYDHAVGPERAERVPLTSLGLLRAADADQPVAHLSVGQRRRLALAIVLADPPELLLLDEPTNHLSPTLCDELEEALGPGPGAIVIASHDRRLRAQWPARQLPMGSART